MRAANVFVQNKLAGILSETDQGQFTFTYLPHYEGPPVSLTMPVQSGTLTFEKFPPFFEGLLPEGSRLESLLQRNKIDRDDYFSQLIIVGADLVGAVTVSNLGEARK